MVAIDADDSTEADWISPIWEDGRYQYDDASGNK